MKKVVRFLIIPLFFGALFFTSINLIQVKKVNAIKPIQSRMDPVNEDCGDPWNPHNETTCGLGGNGCLPISC